MKTDFSYRPVRGANRGRGALVTATLAIVAALVFDFLSGGALRHRVQSLAALSTSQAERAVAAVSQSGFLSSRGALARENASLRERLAALEEQEAALTAVRAENDDLRTLVSLAKNESGITAPVLSSFRASPYGTFLIGAGSADGVGVGSVVLTPGGFVLGIVSDVQERRATVKALFSAGESTEVAVAAAAFTAEGHGGGNARAQVPRDARIVLHDTVIAPGLGGRPVGVVGEVKAASSSASATIYVRLPVNLETIRFVYVVPAR